MLNLDLTPEAEQMFKKVLINYKNDHTRFVKNIYESQISELKKEMFVFNLSNRK